ncbi:MAG TPA: glycosyltransferase [Aggregatilineales bacterium]|nr:glycosyltransferase [Aggregatilineales bacterium]
MNTSYQMAARQSFQTSRMRIGQFTDSFPPIINGVSAFISEHHQQLLRQGCRAYIFTFGYNKYRAPGVVRSPGLPYGPSEFRTNLFLSPRATRLARGLDVFHVHEPFGIGGIALRIARQADRPVIFTNHTQHDVYIENFPKLIQPPLQGHMLRTMATFLRSSAISTTPSEFTARWMRHIAPEVGDRVQVVHNGIDLSKFDHAGMPFPREQLGISPSSTVFIYVGRLTPEKNLPVFAEAFLQAVQSGSDADWIVVGEGRLHTVLQEQLGAIASRVHFLGAMPRQQIPAYLALADVFATPSLSEVNPISVIEAMASGKPFIGLQAGWWSEFEGHERAGILTQHSTPALLDAISRLCRDRAHRLAMGIQARLVSQQFDIRSVTARWLELYSRVAATTSVHSAWNIRH